MHNLAPIVLFCYNRPEHTLRTLQALSENILAEQSRLFVFCDGPKLNADAAQLGRIEDVRHVVKSRKWCSEVYVTERDVNLGLANSVIDGVTKVLNTYDYAIVLEDDLVTSKYFLEYMNIALEKYKNEDSVFQVSGHQFPILTWKSKQESFFLPFTTSWGWGTWKRAWDCFNPSVVGYQKLNTDVDLKYRFNLNNSYAYSDMLTLQIEGKIDSWAIRWWWSVFLLGGQTLFPDITLIENIGFGAGATHTSKAPYLLSGFDNMNRIILFPEVTRSDFGRFEDVCNFLRIKNKSSFN
jgi:hypothetical protein